MKTLKPLGFVLLFSFLGCAARPAYVAARTRPEAAAPRWRDAKPSESSPVRIASRAGWTSAQALKKDDECAILHDSLKSLHDQDASIRAFTARFGEAETRAMARRVRRSYEAKGCPAWLARRGGVESAWRRVRVARLTSLRMD